jgi:haloacetate dehalogenase
MFEGFARQRIETAGSTINVVSAGHGEPLLLLHGCPQTLVMWHVIAPRLAEDFTVVCADLRGYGDSAKPPGDDDHANYSFRAMAADQLEVMRALGHERFLAAGHDRGARVVHRLALDHPGAVRRVALLDILPTLTLYERTDAQFATAYWEWFFFLQGNELPETLIAAAPETFLRHELGALVDRGVIAPEAWDEYLRAISDRAAVHAMCEDYRAGASIDLEHDRADLAARIPCPVLLLWGEQNPIWERFDMLEVWRERAMEVAGGPLPCGHYLAEEAPDLTAERLRRFFLSDR